jgi:hypothetical protein
MRAQKNGKLRETRKDEVHTIKKEKHHSYVLDVRNENAACDDVPENVGTTTHDDRTISCSHEHISKDDGGEMREVNKHIKSVVNRCIGGSTVP